MSADGGAFATLARIWQQLITGYTRHAEPKVPAAIFPPGFSVHSLADTGVYVIDNFCTAAEASNIVVAAKDRLVRSGVLIDGKFQDSNERKSHTAQLYGPHFRYPGVVPLMCRAAALVGLPYTNVENVYVTRYQEGEFYAQHIDYGDSFNVDRLYTLLLYLNTVPEEQGGATVFPSLKTAIQPVAGRAVSWTNKNPDGSGHLETNHAAFPIKNGGEKWVIQFWFRNYRVSKPLQSDQSMPTLLGERSWQQLRGDEELPEGVHFHQ